MWLRLCGLKRPSTTLEQSIDSVTEVIYVAGRSRAKAPSHNTTNAVAGLWEAQRA